MSEKRTAIIGKNYRFYKTSCLEMLECEDDLNRFDCYLTTLLECY